MDIVFLTFTNMKFYHTEGSTAASHFPKTSLGVLLFNRLLPPSGLANYFQ